MLKQALKDYDGTFLIVSHDRDFLHGLTNRLLEVKDGRLRDHHMDILELIDRNKASASMNDTVKQVAVKQRTAGSKVDNRLPQKEQEKELRRLRNAVQRCEQEMARLESEQKQLQDKLADNPSEKDYARLAELAGLIEQRMKDWERAGNELEALAQEIG